MNEPMSEEAPAGQQSYFLSYSRTDERFAIRLAKDLRERGVSMWVDQLDIRPSEHWDRAIERAVRDCKGLVVVLSPRSAVSDNVADEISFAIDSGKSVLPVMIERCSLPLRITRMQVIDATRDYDSALEQCFAELTRGGDATARPAPAPQQRAPIEPQAITSAKQKLAPIVGPIAGVLVDKAAARAGSVKDFYTLVGSHIDSEADRKRFLMEVSSAVVPDPPPSKPAVPPPPSASGNAGPISSEVLDRMTGLMTRYIGPIATVVVKRESRAASSPQELRRLLADLISDQKDRAEFLRQAE
jgi:hypothetical protein